VDVTPGAALALVRRIRLRRAQRWGPAERRTLALGVVGGAVTLAALAVEVGRVWRRGSAPLPLETDDLLLAAGEAVTETVEVARAGYQNVPTSENAMFNLFASFVTTFAIARGITYLLRGRSTFGPFRDVHLGRRHIHHFVPGIAIAFASGATAILTRDQSLEPRLAVTFGVGMGLTLDESALLLELDDVYWTREGLVSIQIALAVSAALAAAILGARFLRRGEQLVLEDEDGGPPPVPSADPTRAAGADGAAADRRPRRDRPVG
jgi:hypothetical protein